MKKLLLVAALAALFTGCTGAITGHEYTNEELETIYGTAKKGVQVFGSEETKDKLAPAGKIIEGTYETVKGNGAQ